MSLDPERTPPPYIIPVSSEEGGMATFATVNPSFVHSGSFRGAPGNPDGAGGGGGGAAAKTDGGFVVYDPELNHSRGVTNCPTCEQQVITNIQPKAGKFAWLMVMVFILVGLATCLLGLLPLPCVFHKLKDTHHTCPQCNRLLHVKKRKCCEW